MKRVQCFHSSGVKMTGVNISDNCTRARVIGVKFQHICGLEKRALPTFILVVRSCLQMQKCSRCIQLPVWLSICLKSCFSSCLLVIFLT